MSNFLAIATVTATLEEIIGESLGTDVLGAKVTAQRPDSSNSKEPRINIFLYEVTQNPALRNMDLPTRRSSGEVVQRPQSALNLHYLLTFYGNETRLEPQRLMGYAIRTLNSNPVLTRQMIRDTLENSQYDFLEGSNLAEQIELVRLTLLPMSTDELTKLWSVFFQIPYNLSVAYQGSVVLIEGKETPQKALPVRERGIYITPFRHPVIMQVGPTEGIELPITADSTIQIRGRQLMGNVTLLKLGGVEVTPEEVTDSLLKLPLRSIPGGSLHAGVHGIQVIHKILMGDPPTPHRGVESNVSAFVLHPTITDIKPRKEDPNRSGSPSISLLMTVDPKIGGSQDVTLLLNEMTGTSPRDIHLPMQIATLAEAITGLQESIRASHTSTAFRETSVIEYASDGEVRLVVLSGVPIDQPVFSATDDDPTTLEELKLDAASPVSGIISEALPTLLQQQDVPSLNITINGKEPKTLNCHTSTNLSDARKELEKRIRGADSSDAYKHAMVATRINEDGKEQLVVLAGIPDAEVTITLADSYLLIEGIAEELTPSELSTAPVRGVISGDLTGFLGISSPKPALSIVIGGTPESYCIKATPPGSEVSKISVPVNGVRLGEYLVRIQVDGAESPLTVDEEEDSPTYGAYIGPRVRIW